MEKAKCRKKKIFKDNFSEQKILFTLLVLVFLAQLLIISVFPSEKPGKELEVDWWGGIAHNLIEGRGYVTYSKPDKPTAARGPVPVLWLVAIFYIFGRSVWAVTIGNLLLNVGTAAILFNLGRYIFPRKIELAVLTVLMFTFYLPQAIRNDLATSEPIFIFLLMLHLLALTYLLDKPSWSLAALSGLWLGLAALARPIVLAFPAVILLIMLFRYQSRWEAAKYFGMLALIFGLVLTPWAVRNYLVFGAFTPSTLGRSSVGQLLFDDHYYLGTPLYPQLLGPPGYARLKREGKLPDFEDQVEEDKYFRDEALARIAQHPGQYFMLSGYRFFRFWFNLGFGHPPSGRSWIIAGLHAFLLTMAVLSFIWDRDVRTSRTLPIWIIILYFTIIHIPLHAQIRYSFPMIPLVILLAVPSIWIILTYLYSLVFKPISGCS